MKLTGAAILVSRDMKVLQAAPAAYPYRSAAEEFLQCKVPQIRRPDGHFGTSQSSVACRSGR
jgi:hypothetical protein